MKNYLAGYVVGMMIAGHECLVEGDHIHSDSEFYHERETRIFKTITAAKQHCKDNGYEYVRGFMYSTNYPKHSKGLREWRTEDGRKIASTD